MKFCDNCGVPNREQARFCVACGTRFETSLRPQLTRDATANSKDWIGESTPISAGVSDSKTVRIQGAGVDDIRPLRELEIQAIVTALKLTNGNVAVAARKLQIGRATLYRKMKEYRIHI